VIALALLPIGTKRFQQQGPLQKPNPVVPCGIEAYLRVGRESSSNNADIPSELPTQ